MTWLDIVLIIIGCILVISSYIITEKIVDGSKGQSSSNVTELWGDKEEGTIKDRVKNIVEDKSEEVVDSTMDRLCHMSNEKIMEFKEYADQVMDSLKEEHKQAVFLYNMLTKKQEELKKLFFELDTKYAALSDKLNEADILPVSDVPEPAETLSANKSTIIKESVDNDASSDSEEINEQANDTTINKAGPDRNERILALFNEGKSVIEISRQLGIGQGEVKLVIDLFRGA